MVNHGGRLLLALLACLQLISCAAVGPDYKLPRQALVHAEAAQGTFASGRPTGDGGSPGKALATEASLPDHWWQLYRDRRLDGLVRQSLAGNVDLRVALAHLQQSQALLDQARSRREPDMQVQASTDYTQQSAQAVLSHAQPPMHGIYNGGLALTEDLDLFGSIRRGIEASAADSQAVAAARDRVRLEVVADTVQAYAQLCNAGARIQVLQQVLDVQRRRLALSDQMVGQGRLAAFEQRREVGDLDSRQAGLAPLKAERLNAAYRLAVLAGQIPERYDSQLLACHRPLQLDQPMPVGDGRALLRRRPDVRAAERKLAAATARLGVATAALYPDIQIGIGFGSTGAVSSGPGPLTNRFAVGPVLNWNLHRNAVRAGIDAADAGVRASLGQFDATVLQALEDTETHLESYLASLERQQLLRAARDEAAQVHARSAELWQGGRVGALVELDARRHWLDAEMAVAAGQADVNRQQVECFRALGGGWQQRGADQVP